MKGLKKRRLALVTCLVACLLLLLRQLFSINSFPTIPTGFRSHHSAGGRLDPNVLDDDADEPISNPSLTIVIREFETFDNDVPDTVESVLRVCPLCEVIVVSDDLVYPPLQLQKPARLVVLSPGLNRRASDVLTLIAKTKYVLLFPDGSRLSSSEQLFDLVRLLESSDSIGVVAGVGGKSVTCQQVLVDVKRWELHLFSTPDSEGCDGVHGRVAILMRSAHFVSLSHPWGRPLGLSLAIQGSLKHWKHHIAKGMVLGEGKELLANEHLQWKYDTARDAHIKTLYATLGIKKVVGSNQKVEWFGCTRQTPRCFPTVVNDTPSYLLEGRWTPPCCLEALRATARHVFIALRACRARWWLEGGSLLGAVRHNDIIPWDFDVDIGIYASDIERCPQLKASRWQTLEDTDGYVWQRGKGYYQVHYSTANHLHVDIFAFIPRDGTMIKAEQWNTAHRQDVDFPEHYLRPLSTVQFAGVQASAPNNVRDYLEYKFGVGVVENPQYPNPEFLMNFNVSLPSVK